MTERDIDDAWERIKRFSKYVNAAYPETSENDGFIDSPIQLINETKKELEPREVFEILTK